MPAIGTTIEYGETSTTSYDGTSVTSYSGTRRRVEVVQWSTYSGNFKTPNPHTFRVIKTRGYVGAISGHRYQSGNAQYTQTTGIISGPPAMPTTLMDPFASLNDMNLEKAMRQLRNGVNLGVDVAEASQTFRMIKGATSLRQLLKEFVRALEKDTPRSWRNMDRSIRKSNVIPKGNTRSARATAGLQTKYREIGSQIASKNVGLTRGQKTLDYATGKWLEYAYGWLPLVHSIYDAVETLDRYYANRGVQIKVRSHLAKPGLDQVTGSGTMADPTVTQGSVTQYRLESVYRFVLPSRLGISDFTTLNPLLLAWELLPYSFVVDWFLNIGKTLEAWENFFRYASYFAGGYETKSFKTTYEVKFSALRTYPIIYWPGTSVPMDGPLLESMAGVSAGNTEVYSDRSILYTLPSPESGIKIEANLGSTRLLSAAALMQQIVRRNR